MSVIPRAGAEQAVARESSIKKLANANANALLDKALALPPGDQFALRTSTSINRCDCVNARKIVSQGFGLVHPILTESQIDRALSRCSVGGTYDARVAAAAAAHLSSLRDNLRLSAMCDIVRLSAWANNMNREHHMDTLLLHSPAQLPAHLKSLRKKRKLTQAQLAKRLGIGQSRLADIEKHPETVSSAQLLDLFAALGVEVLLRVKPTPKHIEDRPRGEW